MQIRKRAILAIALIVLIGLIFYVMFSSVSVDEDSPDFRDSQRSEEKGFWESLGIGGDSDNVKEPLSPKQILFSNAAEYRRRSAFPPDSLPIIKENDPVKEDFEIIPPAIPNPDHPEGPYLVYYPKKNSFSPEEPLIVHAYLIDEDKNRIPPDSLEATLTIGGLKGRILNRLDLQDNGQQGDSKAGDLIYTTAFSLPPDLQKATKPTNLTVVIKAQTSVGEILVTTAFNVGSLGAAHTGKFFDRVDNDTKGNHLLIEAEMEITKPGMYHIQGSLYTESGKDAIGWAQNRVKLEAGTHKVPIKFYGKMFCDAGVDGPYRLQYFAYANVTAMPGPRSENIKGAHTTGVYKAKDFTCTPYDDPDFLEKARQLEELSEAEDQ